MLSPSAPHRVVIVGGGFGGVRVARSLERADVQITLIDRTNHHLFQPLLYQVATGVLSPVSLASEEEGLEQLAALSEVASSDQR